MIHNANFIAIDFETATPQRAACQIGIVVVKGGNIVKEIIHLIQPPQNKYSDRCIKVHGITPELTANSPTFDILWNDIREYFEGNFIVAHNAAFDLDVLYKSLDAYQIPYPIFMGTACTYHITGLSLQDACTKYNVNLCDHHDGLCDSRASAQLFLMYLNGEFYDDFIREYTDDCTRVYDNNIPSELFTIKENPIHDPFAVLIDSVISSLNPLPLFSNKRFIITGNTIFDRDLAYDIIKKLGGKKSSSVSKSLDYAIIGEFPGPKKIQQLNELKEEGYSVKTLSDIEFVDFIKSTLNTMQ